MRTILVLLASLTLAMLPQAAFAHAHLDHAVPAVGSTVVSAPQEIMLYFTQDLEPAFSSVEVTDASGASISQGKPQIAGNTMQIGIKASGPGTYTVHWHAVSVDTHKTEGTFSFTVSQP